MNVSHPTFEVETKYGTLTAVMLDQMHIKLEGVLTINGVNYVPQSYFREDIRGEMKYEQLPPALMRENGNLPTPSAEKIGMALMQEIASRLHTMYTKEMQAEAGMVRHLHDAYEELKQAAAFIEEAKASADRAQLESLPREINTVWDDCTTIEMDWSILFTAITGETL